MIPWGTKVGAVSFWQLMLLFKRQMFVYEIIIGLKTKFSGHRKPKTGTKYAVFEKFELKGFVTSRTEFREEALTESITR
jgi:DNA-binding PadR family transcriptional regulator